MRLCPQGDRPLAALRFGFVEVPVVDGPTHP